MSAYACEPHKGSEPGVGWNMATEMAKHHDVWVLTRTNNREAIGAELAKHPVPGLHFIYYDLPIWARWWKKGGRGVQLYYYLWQRFSWPVIKSAHAIQHFDLTHHVTFGKYWIPSMLPKLPVPFVWGTVGGGESMPGAFFKNLRFKDALSELSRVIARWLGEHLPGVRATARRSAIALASTQETAARLQQLGCRRVKIVPQCALAVSRCKHLLALPDPPADPLRFISIGRPLHWKGFHLGIKAFAAASLPDAEYWIIANGTRRERLETLVHSLKIGARVRFLDKLSSLEDVYGVLSHCHVLVHPALHEAFGNVVLEAMAAGRPALTLDLGGPALQVKKGGGIAVPVHTPDSSVAALADVMREIADNPAVLARLSKEAREQVQRNMTWETRMADISSAYGYAMQCKNEDSSSS